MRLNTSYMFVCFFRNNNVLILGEVSKWVTVSPSRIQRIEPTAQNITLTLGMGLSETVDIDLMLNMKHMKASCTSTAPHAFNMKMTISGLNKVHCEYE